MERYNEMYEKSKVSHNIESRKIVTIDAKKFSIATLKTISVLVALSITISGTFNFFKDQHLRTEMAIMASSEAIENGFAIAGNYDTRYDLIDDIELFELYLILPETTFNSVLKHRGFETLEDYFNKNGFENFDDWKEKSIENYQNEAKSRSI